MKKGFTLIELMIVVAIVGILSMMAVPAYQDYVKRTYVAEGFANLAPVKSAIIEHYMENGQLPEFFHELAPGSITAESFDNGQGGHQRVKLTSKMHAYLYYGAIVLHASDDIEEGPSSQHPREVVIVPMIGDGSIRWLCGENAMMEAPHLVSTTYGYNNLNARYLPSECRYDPNA